MSSTGSTSTVTSLRAARAKLLADESLRGRDFCRAYAAAADAWLAGLLDAATGGDTTRIALIAVGGYGRGELCPGSDLDVAFVHHPRRRHIKRIADAVWYPVWDEGVHLDHSVRTPRGVLSTAKDDLKVMLGLLDARLVAGDAELARQVIERAKDQWHSHAREMVPLLAESVARRHARRGDVAFLLEPDVKEDRGGLRDIHALHSAHLTVPVVAAPDDDSGIARANETLLSVRVELHRRSGKETDQLLLQEQDPVAAALGYADADLLMADVAEAGRSIAQASDDCWRRVQGWLAGPKNRAGGENRPIERGLVVRDGEIDVGDDAEPAHDASLALRAASCAAEIGVPIARSCLARLAAETPTPGDPWPDAVRQALVRLLGTGRSAISEIESLDSHGLVVRLLPEWEAVRNRPQRNAFHRFTVDRHLCEAAAAAATHVRDVARPDLLLVGTLLHDIGKGFPGDHTEAGVTVVDAIARRMGFDENDTAVLVGLVRHHLLLPDTAAKRDLDDPATIDTVAAAAGSEEMIRLLQALTLADSSATGPAAATPWKMRMVRELVTRSLNRLAGTADGAAADSNEFDPFLAKLVTRASEVARPVLSHEPLPDGDGWNLRIAAPDKPGLLASVAGVLALHGLGVRTAAVGTPAPGVATETFAVEPVFDREPRWDRLEEDLAAATGGSLDLEARLAARTADYAGMRRSGAALPAEAKVLVDNEASRRSTVVEVRAPDGIGVLHKITSALLDCGLDIQTAKVHTLGHEVVDTFYVRRMVDGTASKVTHPSDLARIEEAVISRLALPASTRP